jgi:protein TonB
MFNNLIESSSHAREFKRRGSFLLFTTAAYLVLFVAAGVVSIYAYDARLDNQNLESITMLSPVDLAALKPAPPTTRNTAAPRPNNNSRQDFGERAIAMASVNHPEIVPPAVSAKPNPNLPVPDVGAYRITGRDFDPGGLVQPNGTGGRGSGDLTSRAPAVDIGTPPPAMEHKTPPRVVSRGVINGQAVSLPKPEYPVLAKRSGVEGTVSVQVLIDENGRVISAKSVAGNPLLAAAAQKAALDARFSPTVLNDQPVKVSGVITYNFQLR